MATGTSYKALSAKKYPKKQKQAMSSMHSTRATGYGLDYTTYAMTQRHSHD